MVLKNHVALAGLSVLAGGAMFAGITALVNNAAPDDVVTHVNKINYELIENADGSYANRFLLYTPDGVFAYTNERYGMELFSGMRLFDEVKGKSVIIEKRGIGLNWLGIYETATWIQEVEEIVCDGIDNNCE